MESTEVLYFTAPWCVPCKVFGPVMDKISEDVNVVKVNIEDNFEMTFDYGVLSVPTVVLMKNGKEADRFVGARTEAGVREFINAEKPSGSIN